MWSDNEAAIDLLQFKYLSSAVIRVITAKHLLPTTIGVFGDWGSGKSSLLQMIQADLHDTPGVLCVTFNGWLFEGYEDAKTALMGTILDTIHDCINDEKPLTAQGRDLFGRLMRRVNWLYVAGLTLRYGLPALMGHHESPDGAQDILGVGAALKIASEEKKTEVDPDVVEKVLDGVPEGLDNIRRNLRNFRRDFAALLRDAQIETLVVFIDDLDRCLPDTIIETLEAIKLFLFAPGTAFVLGADERLVEYAVRQRFPELPGTETEVGRDYLEKLVQIPLRIPPLNGAEIESYINLLFAQLRLPDPLYQEVCQRVAQPRGGLVTDLAFNIDIAREILGDRTMPPALEEDLDLTVQIAPVLTPGLGGNPRRTKRFLNTLLLRMEMSAERRLTLQRRVLAKLMLLEYLKPEFFKQLARVQAAHEGKPDAIGIIEDDLKDPSADPTEGIPSAPEGGKPASEAHETKVKDPKSAPKSILRTVTTEIPPEVQPWLADDWMRVWLTSEPSLKGVDLRPYFYIAHDKVGALDDSQLRLSPAARDILNKLLDTRSVTRSLGLSRSANLSAPDATAVFQALAQRIRQAEVLDDRSPQQVLFELMTHRPDLLPQLVTLFGSLPETKLTLATPALLHGATRGGPSDAAARAVLDRWSRSSNEYLARATKTIIGRMR